MSGANLLLSIDLGTTAIKVALFGIDGRLLAVANHEYQLLTPADGVVELPAPVYWETSIRGIRDVIASAKIDARRIAAIGISSQGETFVPMDERGHELRNAIVWLDSRAGVEAQEMADAFPVEVYHHTTGLNAISPMWLAAKILWLKRHEPDVFARAEKFPLVHDYVIHKLTGAHATEGCVSCTTGFFDLTRYQWWDAMLDFVGIDSEHLSDLHHSGEIAGRITQEAAKTTGLAEGTPVATGAMDQMAAAVGAGNVAPGTISASIGTALAIVATTDQIVLDPERRMFSGPSAVRGRFILLPYAQTAGMALKWLRDAFVDRDYGQLDEMAGGVAPGADGLTMLPHLTGSTCPSSNPSARGAFVGMSLSHGQAHFVRATMESVAYMLREIVEMLEGLGIPTDEVRAMGGGAKSPFWLQMMADVLGKPVAVMECTEAACLGAAILAGVAAGVYPDIETGVQQGAGVGRRHTPNAEVKTAYDKAYTAYQQTYSRLYPDG